MAGGVAARRACAVGVGDPASVQVAEPDPVPIAPEPFELPEDEHAAEEAELAPVDAAPSEPVIDMLALEQALDMSRRRASTSTAIEQRYPLLRNAL